MKIDGSAGKGPNSARIVELRAQLNDIKEYFPFLYRNNGLENKLR